MFTRINLADCLPDEIVTFRYYDERRCGIVEAMVAILTKEPIVITVKNEDRVVRSFRFDRTKLGPLSLPHHVALAGTMFLVGDGLVLEQWTVKDSLQLRHHPTLAHQLRHIGRMQTGVELTH